MSYLVHLDFKRGCGFSIPVEAASEKDAIAQASLLAPLYGFDAPVKKAKAIQQGSQV